MDLIIESLQGMLPVGITIESILQALLVLIIGILALSGLARAIFGQDSVINRSMSSAISILFIYVITICVQSFGVNLGFLLTPLPFVQLSGDTLAIFSFLESDYTYICHQVLNMIILAFLANLTDQWLPTGKSLAGWFFFRCVAVLLAMVLHLLVHAIIAVFVPEGLFQWAPMVLLGILAASMMVGGLKVIVGIVIGTVNPIIGVLYTFFFANIIGKMISKAVLTTLILSCMILVLNRFGITAISVAPAALMGYIPFLLVLLAIWYVIGHLFIGGKRGKKD